MKLNNNTLTLTDDEVRDLQVKIRRINKDPEKFKNRPDLEKQGLNYNIDGTWSIDLPNLDDENILRSTDIVYDQRMLDEIFEQLTPDQLKQLIDSDLLKQLCEDNFDDVWSDKPKSEIRDIILDTIDRYIIDEDTAKEIASWYPIKKIYGDLKYILKIYNEEEIITDEDLRECISSESAYNILKDEDKSTIIDKFDIQLPDLKKDKSDVINELNISIIDVIKSKLNKLFN